MSNEKTPTETPKADKPTAEVGRKVETNNEVEDLNASAEKARDPYARKPDVEVIDKGNGRKVENYS